jgi:hypothetical protein
MYNKESLEPELSAQSGVEGKAPRIDLADFSTAISAGVLRALDARSTAGASFARGYGLALLWGQKVQRDHSVLVDRVVPVVQARAALAVSHRCSLLTYHGYTRS